MKRTDILQQFFSCLVSWSCSDPLGTASHRPLKKGMFLGMNSILIKDHTTMVSSDCHDMNGAV
ncbi:uncharacterized protein BT62DRAFT_939171 [Guyanagaster necrorhizus]|uniref:Uncharacterized protein n=1 Tax=Guyanagaster necrorhizus TaxID=856835 RepID=A0A9P7VF32_9AGAR|nr:uncharacterized protein BT62DRAFT_939171 [Guyanagaster necrorhizus MCA 3950]KAG7439230.1 hypothetical protein BT62DRAFT_939171 [Guyanagaster necrorhizus MCA 3950]